MMRSWDQYQSRIDDITAEIEELEVLRDHLEWEQDKLDFRYPTLWETLTPEEKRARRTAMENALHDDYLPALREALNKDVFVLKTLSSSESSPELPRSG